MNKLISKLKNNEILLKLWIAFFIFYISIIFRDELSQFEKSQLIFEINKNILYLISLAILIVIYRGLFKELELKKLHSKIYYIFFPFFHTIKILLLNNILFIFILFGRNSIEVSIIFLVITLIYILLLSNGLNKIGDYREEIKLFYTINFMILFFFINYIFVIEIIKEALLKK